MVNVCLAQFGKPIFEFSIVNSGDWIDKQAAKATGESPAFINQEKTKVSLSKPAEGLVHQAIRIQYELMIQRTVSEIKKGLEKYNPKISTPIDIVIAGGTSSPEGFRELFEKYVNDAHLNIQIGSIIRPSDPLYSVAKGCLLAAENHV